ncbi:hypothetical protein E4T56_gene19010 [Termitomyces sp. T112]|nr:hypothetical protein E4T56_gene19010 [Termitomyces sp. T112]KNZ80736.1 DnaJ like protein subfamily A member 3, mitochondrial [Termitomyces sp. J132]
MVTVSSNCASGPSSLRLLSRTTILNGKGYSLSGWRCRRSNCQRLFSTSQLHFDHYKTLGVPRSATKGQIKSHFYQLSRKHHPDVSKDAKSKEVFTRVTEAYTVLSNDRERRLYDRSLLSRSGPIHPVRHGHPHQGPGTSNYGYRPRPGSTATHAWEYSRRHSSPYTRSSESSRSQAHQGTHIHRQPGKSSHYEPWRSSEERTGYVNQNDKVLEELERDLEIQRISGSWRALQIMCVLAMAIGMMGSLH